MGRRKLKITKLEDVKERQVKYSKRKVGVLKKAKELATLCDVDVALVMFSPTGKPSHYAGHHKNLSAIVEKFSRLSIEDRERRKDYTTNLIKKVYAKKDPNNNKKESNAIDRVEELKVQTQQLDEVKEKLIEKRKILRDWKNPYHVDSLEQIKIMEDHLKETIKKLHNIKAELKEEQDEASSHS